MEREEATRFLLEDCVFRAPLSLSAAEDLWQTQKQIVDALPALESTSPNKIALSAADLKAARKFRSKYPSENSIVDFATLNPMDLVIHQLWISTAIADRYKSGVTPDRWHRTALLESPPDAGLKWRREESSIIFDLPRFEYLLMGPFGPDGTMRPGTWLDFVSVAFHRGRALLVSGYHRTFAAARYAREAANAPRGILFGVSRVLELMGSGAAQTLRIVESARPPRLADFFDDRLALPVMLRNRRYQMRIHVQVVAVDADTAEQNDGSLSNATSNAAPMTASGPSSVNSMMEDAVRHYRAERLDEAADLCRRALFLKPDSAEANNTLGAVLAKQQNLPGAVELYSRALALKPDFIDAHYNLGQALMLQGNPDDAIVHLRRVIEIDPAHAGAHQQLGLALACKGRFEDAMSHCERAFASDAGHVETHYTRAGIKTFHRGDPDLAAMERLAAADHLSAKKRILVNFALAKAFDDIGDFERAFQHLSIGNQLKRSMLEYDEAAVMKFFDLVASTFDVNTFEGVPGLGNNSPLPIFILGMPRSGSTLVEQILASHPQVHAGGELEYLRNAADPILRRRDEPIRSGNERDREALQNGAASYISQLQALAEGKLRIVDKMPGNFLYVGLIHLMFPNARIVHTVREPLDTCVSCYSKLFQTRHDYTYELGELGRFYRRYAGLMDHWRSMLPAGSVLDIAYENVVDDLEGQARRLIDFCGLPWDDRCLDFHRTDRAISTSSNFQVRQPMFRSSLARWRNYEFGLGPLRAALGDTTPRQVVNPEMTLPPPIAARDLHA